MFSKHKFLAIAILLLFCVACHHAEKAGVNKLPDKKNDDTLKSAIEVAPTAANDTDLFDSFFKQFKQTVSENKTDDVTKFLYFPLQTTPVWTNDDLKNTTINYTEGLISQPEFSTYYGTIFSTANRRELASADDDNISKVDNNSSEDYYQRLQALTDKNSAMFQLDIQYVISKNHETSFAFVFGRVKGSYKVISYFSTWPVKG